MEIYSPDEDSWLLADTVKNFLSKNSPKKILEIGSGSGFQLQNLKKLGIKKQNIFSCDTNPNAVKHCRELGFNCIESNLFQNICGKFHIVLFNPPYLPDDKREPKNSKLATTGGKNGSEIINEFLKSAKSHLEKNSKIFLLTSSLTKGIKWNRFKKRKIASKKLFFEEIYVWELKIN